MNYNKTKLPFEWYGFTVQPGMIFGDYKRKLTVTNGKTYHDATGAYMYRYVMTSTMFGDEWKREKTYDEVYHNAIGRIMRKMAKKGITEVKYASAMALEESRGYTYHESRVPYKASNGKNKNVGCISGGGHGPEHSYIKKGFMWVKVPAR